MDSLHVKSGCPKALSMGYSADGLVQERRNPIANALELRLSCTKPLLSDWTWQVDNL